MILHAKILLYHLRNPLSFLFFDRSFGRSQGQGLGLVS